MISEMITSAHLALSYISTSATSETAQYIAEQSNEGRRRTQSAYSLGLSVIGDPILSLSDVQDEYICTP